MEIIPLMCGAKEIEVPIGMTTDTIPLPEYRGVAVKHLLWPQNSDLTVYFMDGDPIVHRKIESFAHQWSDHCNIRFIFTDDPDAIIRITFTEPGAWSYIGTDALNRPSRTPTMNYGTLQAESPDEEYSRLVLHEFGHAIGLGHEHLHPEFDIQWNKEALFTYYAQHYHWTQEDVVFNILNRYNANETVTRSLDHDSIMMYPILPELTFGTVEVGWNLTLSEADKTFINFLYPKVLRT